MIRTDGLTLIAAPAALPVSFQEITQYARLDDLENEAIIFGMIRAVVEHVSGYRGWMNRQLISATYQLSADTFDELLCRDGLSIALPRPPLQAVTAVTYVDVSGNRVAWDAANYVVLTNREPGLLRLAETASWPSHRGAPHRVEITYVAGYGDDLNAVPQDLRLALAALVSYWNENREAYLGSAFLPRPVANQAEAILGRYKVYDHG